MLKDGKYAAWFRTSRGEGSGIVYLAHGKISGGDTVIAYGGTYQVDGDRFVATLTTRRHAAGQPSVFGFDEVELRLTGTSRGTIATCSGTVHEVPGMVFEAILILSQDPPPQTKTCRTPTAFNTEKLPRLPLHKRAR